MLENAVGLTIIGFCLLVIGLFVAYVVLKRREGRHVSKRLAPQQKGAVLRHMESGEGSKEW